MADRRARRWEEVRRQRPLNEKRIATYERLMAAEDQIAEALYSHGVSDETIMAALAASEPDGSSFEHELDRYLITLARYVSALGGQLELRAVFPDQTVVLLNEPPPRGGAY